MSKQKTTVTVSFDVEIEFDPARFTPEFQSNFRRYFFQYDTVREHLEHLARNHVLGHEGKKWDPNSGRFRYFAEGYGFLDELDITLGEPEESGYDFDNEAHLDQELPSAKEPAQ